MHRTVWLARRATNSRRSGLPSSVALGPAVRSIFPSLSGLQRGRLSSSAYESFTEDAGNENLDVETPDVQDPIYRNVQRVRAQQAYVDEIKTTKFRSARELLELLDEVQEEWWSKDIILSSLSKLTSLARRGDRLKAEVGDSLRLSPDTRLMSLADGSSTLAGTEELGAEARYAHVLRAAADQVSTASSEWSDKELVAVLRLLKPAAQEADKAFATAVCDAISARMLSAPDRWGTAQLTATLQSAATAPGVPLDFISLCSEQLSSKLSLPTEHSASKPTSDAPSLSALSAAVVAVRDALHFKALAGELGALQGGGQLAAPQMDALLAEANRAVFQQLEAGGTAVASASGSSPVDAVVPKAGDSPAVSQARVHALALRELQSSLQLPAIASALPTLPSPSWRAVSSMQSVRVWHMNQEHDDALGVEQQRSLQALASPSNAADVLQAARFAQSANELAEVAVARLATRSSSEWRDTLSTPGTLKAITAVADLLPQTADAAAVVSAASSVLSQDLPDLAERSCAQCLYAVTRVLDSGLAQELSRAPGDMLAAQSSVQGSLQLLLSVCHRLSVELQLQLEAVGDRTQLTAHERRRMGKKNKQGLAHLVHREQLHYTRGDVVQLVNYAADALGSLQRWLQDAVPGMSEQELVHVGERVRPSSTSDPVELAAAGLVALRHVLSEPLLGAAESHSSRLAPGELLSVLASYRSAGLQEGALEAMAVPAGTAAATGPVDVAVAVAHEYWRAGYGGELQWVDPHASKSASEQDREALRATVKRMEAARSGDLASTLGALRELDTGPALVSKGDAVLQALQVRVQRETPDMESHQITQLLGLMSDVGLRHHATFAAAASQLHERLQHWPTHDILRFLSSLPPAGEFQGDASHAVKFAVMAASDALTPAALSVYRGGSLPEIAGLSLAAARSKLAETFKSFQATSVQGESPLGHLEPWAAAAAARVVAEHGVVNSAFLLSAVQSALGDSTKPVSDSSFLDTFRALSGSFSTLESRKYNEAAQQGTAAGTAMEKQRLDDLAWHGRTLSVAQHAWLQHSKQALQLDAMVVSASLEAHVAAVTCGATQLSDVLPLLAASPRMLQTANGGIALPRELSSTESSVGDALQTLARYLVDGPLLHAPERSATDALVSVLQASGTALLSDPSLVHQSLNIAATAAEAASCSTQLGEDLAAPLAAILRAANAAAEEFVLCAGPAQLAAAAAASSRCAGYLSTLEQGNADVRSAFKSSIVCSGSIARAAAAAAGADVAGGVSLEDLQRVRTATAGGNEADLDTSTLAWLDTLDTVSALALAGEAQAPESALHTLLHHSSVMAAACLGCAKLPSVEDVQDNIHKTSFNLVSPNARGILDAFGSEVALQDRLAALLAGGSCSLPTAVAVQTVYSALKSHQLAELIVREGIEDEDMTLLSAELAALYDSLQPCTNQAPDEVRNSWAGSILHAQAELAVARSIITAAEAAGLTSHGIEGAEPAEAAGRRSGEGGGGGEGFNQATPPEHSPRGFTGKLQSMFDSFVQAGEAASDSEGGEIAYAPAAEASQAEWCAESHPTEGLLAATATIAMDTPAGRRISDILLKRASPAALQKAPVDSESLALALQHAAALAGLTGSTVYSSAAQQGVADLAQHVQHVLAQLQGEHVETEAVLAAVPSVKAVLADCQDDLSRLQLLNAIHEALLFCAEQDADSSDATLALQNCASLASVASDIPGTTQQQAARWAEAVKESLHTALAHAPEWEAPRDSLGGQWSADIDTLLGHGVRQVGPRPLRMRGLLQWYLQEQKRAAHVQPSASGAAGVQRLLTTPRGAEPAFVHGGADTAQQTRAAQAAAREVREAAAALQDGLVPLTPPILRLLADISASVTDGGAGPAAELVGEVQHCTRLCLPALWANLHDGVLPSSVLVETCTSLMRLSAAGVSVRALYSLRAPATVPGEGVGPPSTPSGAEGAAGAGNMLADTAHFMLASLMQRHASHVQQSVVAGDEQTATALGAGTAAAIRKAPALRLTFADRVNLLQCVSAAPDVLLELPSALRLALWGLQLPDDEGDSIGTAALPAATDALGVVSELVDGPAASSIDTACAEQVLHLTQAFSSLFLNTASLLAPPLSGSEGAPGRDEFLDNVSAESIQAACEQGLLELGSLLRKARACPAGDAAAVGGGQLPSPVQRGIAGCLAACMQGLTEHLQHSEMQPTSELHTRAALREMLSHPSIADDPAVAAAAASLSALLQ